MKKINEVKILTFTGIFTALFCCFGLIAGLPIFWVTAAIAPKLSQALVITILVISSASLYLTFNLDHLGYCFEQLERIVVK